MNAEIVADIATIEQEAAQMRARMDRLERERDELLFALENLCNRAEFVAESLGWPAYKKARSVIASVKGGAS